MHELLQAIILRVTAYSENSTILSLLTAQGIRSVFLNHKKKYHSLIQEGLWIECELYRHQTQTLSRVRELSRKYASKQLESSVTYHLIWSYCIDLLRSSITYPNPDAKLFDFVCQSLLALDKSPRPSLFPLAFSFKLLKFLGLAVAVEELLHYQLNLNPELAQVLTHPDYELPAILPISRPQKQQLLTQLMQHYSLHIPDFRIPDSIRIIQQILS